MERLTLRFKSGLAGMALEHEELYTVDEWIDTLQSRLADYEDTGLTPEEIMELKAENKELRGRLERVRVAAMP